MGAERWITFENVGPAKSYLNGISRIEVPNGDSVGVAWDGDTLTVSFSVNHLGSTMAELVCREMATRFRVIRFGSDTIGWFGDGGPIKHWPEWIRTYDPVREYFGSVLNNWVSIRRCERDVVQWFRDRDALIIQ